MMLSHSSGGTGRPAGSGRDAGIVDQDVEAAKRGDCLRHDALDVGAQPMSQRVAISRGFPWRASIASPRRCRRRRPSRRSREGTRKFAADAGGAGGDEDVLRHGLPRLPPGRCCFHPFSPATSHSSATRLRPRHLTGAQASMPPTLSAVFAGATAGGGGPARGGGKEAAEREAPRQAPRQALARLRLSARLPAARGGRARARAAVFRGVRPALLRAGVAALLSRALERRRLRPLLYADADRLCWNCGEVSPHVGKTWTRDPEVPHRRRAEGTSKHERPSSECRLLERMPSSFEAHAHARAPRRRATLPFPS